LVGSCNGIAQAQKGAEESLADYLLKYDDFYQEFALEYRGEAMTVRKAGQEVKERLRLIEGIVLESESRGIRYGAYMTNEPIGTETPSTFEELTIGGKLFTKQYGTIGNKNGIAANRLGETSAEKPAPGIVFCFQPHGLSLLRDAEMRGRESEIRRLVPTFLKHHLFVEERDLEKGGVQGVWISQDKSHQCTIDFSQVEEPLPTKVIWELVGNKVLGKSKCTTITKWKKNGDLYVPERIDISSQLGEGTTEVRLEFAFVKKERFEREIKEINPDFVNALGTAWIDRFTTWFEK